MNRKINLLIICILVLTSFILIILGISYALFNYKKNGLITNSLTTGIYRECKYNDGEVWTFDYTGDSQSFIVPCKGTYKVELWGAGHSTSKGAYTNGIIYLEKNKNLFVYIGENPTTKKIDIFNGGGSSGDKGSSGNGATDIRLINSNWDNFDSLKSRIMVASGASTIDSSTTLRLYGHGGGLTGIDGMGHSNVENGVTGGTQTSGGISSEGLNPGTFGIGAGDTLGKNGDYGAGGGGGYYGGGASWNAGAGGGGSSFISGYPGCDAIDISSTVNNINHTGQAKHYSGYVFTDSVMKAGNEEMPSYDGLSTMTGNSGNGYAKITLVKAEI